MGGGPPGLASSISIFISSKSSSEEVAEGNGEHFRLSAGSAPAPVLRAGFPIKHTLFIPGGALATAFCTAFPFTSPHCCGCTAAFLGTTASPLRGAFWEDRGLLPEEGSPAGLPAQGCSSPTGKCGGQDGSGMRGADYKRSAPQSYFSLACVTPARSSPSIFDSFYPSPF